MKITDALNIALRLMRLRRETAEDNATFMVGTPHYDHFVKEADKYTEAVSLLEELKRKLREAEGK